MFRSQNLRHIIFLFRHCCPFPSCEAYQGTSNGRDKKRENQSIPTMASPRTLYALTIALLLPHRTRSNIFDRSAHQSAVVPHQNTLGLFVAGSSEVTELRLEGTLRTTRTRGDGNDFLTIPTMKTETARDLGSRRKKQKSNSSSKRSRKKESSSSSSSSRRRSSDRASRSSSSKSSKSSKSSSSKSRSNSSKSSDVKSAIFGNVDEPINEEIDSFFHSMEGFMSLPTVSPSNVSY